MKNICRILLVFSFLLLIWQLLVTILNIPSYILPSPIQVGFSLIEQHEVIWHESLITILETIVGLSLGILFGILAGLLVGYFNVLSLWLLPLLIISQAIPVFAIAPLLVIWFGYGIVSKIVTTILMIFFPICSAIYDGLKQSHEGWESLAKTMGAKKWRFFYYIRIPAALPSLASGIRIAAVIAPIGAIVGEWVGSSQGLGFLMLNANAQLQIDMMFAALIVIIGLALILYFIIDRILKYLIWWQPS